MPNNPSTPDANAAAERPLVTRSTIVILLSYQLGMMLGNGIPTTIQSLLYLTASIVVVAYLSCVIFRTEKERKRQAKKHRGIARQVDRRIHDYIVEQPEREQHAPTQTRMRTDSSFVSVVSS